MITFKQYEDTVKKISKKLKISKDHALAALTKIQQKGIDPLKWQQHMTMLQQFTHVVADYKPEPVDERSMTQMQKVTQMQHYWDNLSHLASDETKKKNMNMRFGIFDIKLDGNKIVSFDCCRN